MIWASFDGANKPLRFKKLRLFAIALLLLLFMPRPAYAYIDPSVGGYVFQILAATLVFILMSLRLFWTRLVGWLGRILRLSNR